MLWNRPSPLTPDSGAVLEIEFFTLKTTAKADF